MRDDARFFLQIQDSIDSEVIGLISHCEFVKEVMNFLDFLYYGKGNISCIYEMCKSFYSADKQDRTLTAYFMDFKKTYEELNVLLRFNPDVKVQQAQREQMVVMSFLVDLPPEFETIESQILFSSKISSLQDIFTRIHWKNISVSVPPSSQTNSAFVSHSNQNKLGCSYNREGGTGNNDNRSHDLEGVVCYYCNDSGHTKVPIRNCRIDLRSLI